MKVKEILKAKPAPVTIDINKHLQDAMRLLIENKIGSLVVVDRDEKPVGIITEHDIFTMAYRYRGDMMDMRIADNMSTDLVTATEEDDICKITNLMIDKYIRHIPIISDGYKLVGILSIRDLLDAIKET